MKIEKRDLRVVALLAFKVYIYKFTYMCVHVCVRMRVRACEGALYSAVYIQCIM